MVFASNLEAAATEMRSLFLSSYIRHCLPKSRSQNWQSAAPPAIVPSRYGFISITFFTEPEALFCSLNMIYKGTRAYCYLYMPPELLYYRQIL